LAQSANLILSHVDFLDLTNHRVL